MWSGIETLDKLRSKAAASTTGTIKVTIEELNKVMSEIQDAQQGNEAEKPIPAGSAPKCDCFSHPKVQSAGCPVHFPPLT